MNQSIPSNDNGIMIIMITYSLAGWPRTKHTLLQAVTAFKSRHSYKLSSPHFIGRAIHQCACRSSDGHWTRHHICWHSLVDVKDPTVSFVKSRWTIAGVMNKFLFEPAEGIASAAQHQLSDLIQQQQMLFASQFYSMWEIIQIFNYSKCINQSIHLANSNFP